VTPTKGIVFATTTPSYTMMARKAARNLRLVDPDLDIDLFTDQNIDDPIFSKVISLEGKGARPKMEAMRRSRFDLTLTLDSDVIAIAPFREVFDLLERYDLAIAHANTRPKSMGMDAADIPRAFPLYNSGVVAIRKSAATQTILHDWERAWRTGHLKADQPSLRRLLWNSDLRLCPLPSEYNTCRLINLLKTGPNHGAPRLLHIMKLDKTPLQDPDLPFSLHDILEPDIARHIQWLLETDYSLGGDPEIPRPTPNQPSLKRFMTKGEASERFNIRIGPV
jgi:hypothetical protein